MVFDVELLIHTCQGSPMGKISCIFFFKKKVSRNIVNISLFYEFSHQFLTHFCSLLSTANSTSSCVSMSSIVTSVNLCCVISEVFTIFTLIFSKFWPFHHVAVLLHQFSSVNVKPWDSHFNPIQDRLPIFLASMFLPFL